MDGKIKVNISNKSDNDAAILTTNAINGLTANLNFTTPAVSLATMTADNDDFILKIGKAEKGSVEDTRVKNIARAKVNKNYRKQGNYVNTICDGDADKAATSGFQFVRPYKKPSKLQLGAKNTKIEGEISVFCLLNFKKFISRVIQITKTPDDATSWDLVGVTRRQQHKVSNLDVGDTYYIRLANVTDPNVIEFCEPFSIIVT